MPAPITVSVDVPQARDEVFAFLDLMANHEPFTDHMMRDWSYSGPPSGVGSKARVKATAFGMTETIDIEVVDASPPESIVERNIAQRSARVGQGTYTLSNLPGGGTHIEFEYRWLVAPLLDRLLSPVVRSYMRGANAKAMRRLAERLSTTGARAE